MSGSVSSGVSTFSQEGFADYFKNEGTDHTIMSNCLIVQLSTIDGGDIDDYFRWCETG